MIRFAKRGVAVLALSMAVATSQAWAHGGGVSLTFDETLGAGLTVDTLATGLDASTDFVVHKNITNASGAVLDGMIVTLEVFDFGALSWVASSAIDGAWMEGDEHGLHVKENGVLLTHGVDWDFMVTGTDQISFDFLTFTIDPGEVLHLGGFLVSNIGEPAWRLHQQALVAAPSAVPVPAALPLMVTGLMGLWRLGRRRRA